MWRGFHDALRLAVTGSNSHQVLEVGASAHHVSQLRSLALSIKKNGLNQHNISYYRHEASKNLYAAITHPFLLDYKTSKLI